MSPIKQPIFPRIPHDQLRAMLEPPKADRDKPIRVVIDTDTNNEIDDQFALAWALLSQDKLQIEGIYAEPYSLQYRVDGLIALHEKKLAGFAMDEEDRGLNLHYAGHIGAHDDPTKIEVDGPDIGMELSYQEILKVYEKMDMEVGDIAFRGANRYMTAVDDPVHSESVEHFIDLAKTASPDEPIYVAAIGCPTNISSAIVLAPEIINNIVVTWTAAFPTSANRPNYSFNLEQDMPASQLLFSSGVPHVYLPGYHVGAQLSISLPEMERWVKGCGAMGD